MVRKLIKLLSVLASGLLLLSATPSYGPGAIPTISMYIFQPSFGNAVTTPTANVFLAVGMPVNVANGFSFGHVVVDISVDDATHNSDFGFATGTSGGTCTLVSHVGATTYASTGIQTLVVSPSPSTLPAGVTEGASRLYFVWTSAATTLQLVSNSTLNLNYAGRTSIGTTSGGSLGTPGTTTFTCPTDSWAATVNMPALAIVP